MKFRIQSLIHITPLIHVRRTTYSVQQKYSGSTRKQKIWEFHFETALFKEDEVFLSRIMWHKRSSDGASTVSGSGGKTLSKVAPDARHVALTNAAPQDGNLLKSPSSISSSDSISVTPSTAGRLKNSNIRSAYIWDVLIPPSLTSFQGHYLPRILTNRNRERRISVEVRAPSTLPSLPEDSSTVATSEQELLSEFTIIRVFVPAASKEAKAIQETAQAIVTTATTAAKIVKETSEHVFEVSKQAVDGLARGPVADSENDEKSLSSISLLLNKI